MARPEFIRETIMAKCPFAVWKAFDGSPGGYAGGHPFKIVHHTTEGSSADGAFLEYRNSKNIPYFTVDDMTIYQHVDTDEATSALKHPRARRKPTAVRRCRSSWSVSRAARRARPACKTWRACAAGSKPRMASPRFGRTARRNRPLVAKIQAATIGINRIGTTWADITATATCPTTCIGTPPIPVPK